MDVKRGIFVEIAGWVGTAAILFAYAAAAWGWIAGDSLTAAALNIVGSVGLLVITVTRRVWQSASVNAIWLVIAVVALFKMAMSL